MLYKNLESVTGGRIFMLPDILTNHTILSVEPIPKGWSEDKKHCAIKEDGTKLLLRTSAVEQFDRKKAEFEAMGKVAALGIPMCQPIEFGIFEDKVYSLQSWIDGEDAEEQIPLLPDTEQHLYGIQAGGILRKIHSIPAPDTQEEWSIRFNRKIDRNMKRYMECGFHFEGDTKIIKYIQENRHLLEGRPQSFQHGDYHIGNMMFEKGTLKIIDFNRFDYGDPWEEFNRIVWCVQKSPVFASGFVNGYFNGEPPLEFWRLLALYISSNTLSAIPWAIPFGQDEVDVMLKQANDVLEWYEGMTNIIPKWYVLLNI